MPLSISEVVVLRVLEKSERRFISEAELHRLTPASVHTDAVLDELDLGRLIAVNTFGDQRYVALSSLGEAELARHDDRQGVLL